MPDGGANTPDLTHQQSEPAVQHDELRQLNIRLSDEVYRIERLIAQRNNMSLAQYVAELVREDAERNRELAAQAARDAAQELTREADLLEQGVRRPAQAGGSISRHKKHPR